MGKQKPQRGKDKNKNKNPKPQNNALAQFHSEFTNSGACRESVELGDFFTSSS